MARRSLGKGLDAILGVRGTSSNDGLLLEEQQLKPQIISVGQLFPGKFQPRRKFTESSLQELANSIKEQGILQPILVRQASSGKYEIIAGERRWRAAKMAGLSGVPVYVKNVSDEVVAAFALIENIQRENLNSIEEAQGYQCLLIDFQLTHDDIAKRVGKSRVAISNHLRLLQLDDVIQELLISGEIAMGHARALLSLSPNLQKEAAQMVVKKQLSVRKTEEMVNHLRQDVVEFKYKPQVSDTVLEEVKTLETCLASQLLDAKVTIKMKNDRAGDLTIKFENLPSLRNLLTND